MGLKYSAKNKHIREAKQSGILPALLRYRLLIGFKVKHLAATEIVDGEYVHGKFEQGDNSPKKSYKNAQGATHPPRHTPLSPTITYKQSHGRIKRPA